MNGTSPETPKRLPKFVDADEVESVYWTVESGRFLLRGEDTGGGFSLFEVVTPAHAGPPFHYHRQTDKAFYVLEGSYEIQVGESLYRAGPGSVVYGPRGVGHGFRNVGDHDGRMLFLTTPGGAELMFEAIAEVLAQGGAPDRRRIGDIVMAHDTFYAEPPAATPVGSSR